ncbi:MAG: DUF6049 family protein [Acidimicrobiia bacterium]
MSQDAWTAAGGVFTMHLRTDGSGSTSGLNLTLTLHDRVATRASFDDTLAVPPRNLGPSFANQISAPFDSLETDANGSRVFSVALQTANDQSPDRLAARRAGGGVYPLEVQVRDSDDKEVSGFITHVVVAELAPGSAEAGTPSLPDAQPLELAWVWPLGADPAYLPDGTPDAAVLDELAPTGRLGRQLTMVDNLTNLPLTLVPVPETMEAWQTSARQRADLAPGIAALQRSVARHEVLAGPFVNLDIPALYAAALEGSLDTEFARGTTTLDRVLGTRLDPRTALVGPLDPRSLQFLRQRGVDRIVVDDPGALSTDDERDTPAHPFRVLTADDSASAVTAVVGDPGFQRLLTGDEPPALRAAHLLAGLAVVQRELPSVTRGITIVNPGRWDASEAFVNAMVTGLRANPFVRPVTVDRLISDVPVPDGPDRTVVSRSPAVAPVTARQLATAFANLGAINNLVGARNPLVTQGERALFASLTSAWQTPEGRVRAGALLDGISGSVGGFLSGIRIPASTTVTITSSRAEVPITFQNDTGQPVKVHVTLESDKLLFPDGNERDIVLPPRNTTFRFAVETRNSGTFPIGVTLTTAGDARFPIQSTQLKIRSTFVSGVGIFLIVAAILFLALWWGWDIRKRRRAKRAQRGEEGDGPRPVVAPAQA